MVKHLTSSSFFVGVAFSLMLGLSQVSLLSVWMSLELNMLMFVAAMSMAKTSLETESMKYFIVQSIGSSVFLTSVVLGALQVSHSLLESLVSLSLVLKLGIAPLHSWFVSVLSGLSWEFLALASTIQKILPLYLFSLSVFNEMLYVLIISVGVSVLGSLNQLETKKLLAYSSIFSAVWMLSCEVGVSTLTQYLSAYTVALLVIISPLATESRAHINEVLTKNYKSKVVIYLTGFFSLGGSPPFLGFYAKIAVAQVILASGQLMYLFYLVSSSVFLLYVYMRFFYQAVVASGVEVETNVSSHFYSSAGALMLIAFMGFPWV